MPNTRLSPVCIQMPSIHSSREGQSELCQCSPWQPDLNGQMSLSAQNLITAGAKPTEIPAHSTETTAFPHSCWLSFIATVFFTCHTFPRLQEKKSKKTPQNRTPSLLLFPFHLSKRLMTVLVSGLSLPSLCRADSAFCNSQRSGFCTGSLCKSPQPQAGCQSSQLENRGQIRSEKSK